MDSITEELVAKVVKQLEYYFSDYNLIRDSFLNRWLKENNGCKQCLEPNFAEDFFDFKRLYFISGIGFEVLIKFNRLNQLVDNSKVVLTKILESCESDSIEVNVVEEKVRRKTNKPLPELNEELIHSLKERTVHVKGFPEDTTYEELEEWSQKYGTVESIEMRHKKSTHEFKGCAFIVFADKSMADQMISESLLEFKAKELMKENRLQYYDRKRQFFAQKRKERNERRAQKEGNPNAVQKGSVLKLTMVPKKLTENSVKEFFDKSFDENEVKVRYVLKVFSKRICFVRFEGNTSATHVFNKIVSKDGNRDQNMAKVVIDGNELNIEPITEEEGLLFWKRDKNLKNGRKRIAIRKQKRQKGKVGAEEERMDTNPPSTLDDLD